MERTSTRPREINIESMNEKIINIGHEVEDLYFDHPQQTMADIVDSLHKYDRVVIVLTEGVALENLNYKEKNFLQILKDLCLENKWSMDKIHFVLPNLVQDKSVWPSIEYGGSSSANTDINGNLFLHTQEVKFKADKKLKHTFGHFVVRSTWDRLLVGSHLYSKHKNKTFQTYCKSLVNPAHMLHMDLDMLLHITSCDKKLGKEVLSRVAEFIGQMPIEKTSNQNISTREPDKVFGWVEGPVDNEILGWYNGIFVDVVSEKMINGKTFFPTEKIARPLATKTPFLIMAAPNYIKNLHKLGFQSFGKFWDEAYDYQQGVQRVDSIQSIIDDLARLPMDELQKMYKEMVTILDHNHKTFYELTPEKILTAFSV
jgi:hypothetical protein